MKTSTLAVAAMTAVSLSLVSCSQDDPIEMNQGRAIDFRPAMDSRATETTNANLTDINVTAFISGSPYFEQKVFSKNGSFFTSATDYYWPGDDTELTFYAFSPATLTGVTLTKDEKTLTDFSPASSIADQVDFITAEATGNKTANEAAGVPLTFDHRLSQIEVRGKTSNQTYTFKVSGIRIGMPVSQGSFDFGTNTWTLADTKTVYESTVDEITLTDAPEGTAAASLMGTSGNAILLPQQLTAWQPETDAENSASGAYLSVKLQISEAETGTVIYPFPSDPDCQWAAIPIDTNWEPGKKYIYTLDFSHGAGYVDPHDPQPGKPVLGGPIKFTVTVTDWTESTQDVDMAV